ACAPLSPFRHAALAAETNVSRTGPGPRNVAQQVRRRLPLSDSAPALEDSLETGAERVTGSVSAAVRGGASLAMARLASGTAKHCLIAIPDLSLNVASVLSPDAKRSASTSVTISARRSA